MAGLPFDTEAKAEPKKSNAPMIKKEDLSGLLLKILNIRGFLTKNDIERFLNPSLKDLYDPMLLPDIKEASKRLLDAVKEKKKIMVFGDFDTDGVISAYLMADFLKELNADVSTFIPDRFKDGYDVSIDFIEDVVIKEGYGLLICVDCGTNNSEVRDFFIKNETHVDVIVCDHHKPAQTYSKDKRYLLINPWVEGCRYPFKALSGAGVTFKFINAVLKTMDASDKKAFKKIILPDSWM
jgi:single-stranded-DNA-specific exonuclease